MQRVPGLNGADANEEDQQLFISTDQKTAIWTAIRATPGFYGIATATRPDIGSPFGAQRPLLAPNNFAPPFAGKLVWIGEANVAEVAEGWVMYLMCGMAGSDTDAGKPADIWIRVCFSRKPR